MDYYSQSSQSKEDAIKEVVKEINEEKIVRSIINNMPGLGSIVGWTYCFKPDVIRQVKIRVHNRKVEAYWVNYVMRKITGKYVWYF